MDFQENENNKLYTTNPSTPSVSVTETRPRHSSAKSLANAAQPPLPRHSPAPSEYHRRPCPTGKAASKIHIHIQYTRERKGERAAGGFSGHDAAWPGYWRISSRLGKGVALRRAGVTWAALGPYRSMDPQYREMG